MQAAFLQLAREDLGQPLAANMARGLSCLGWLASDKRKGSHSRKKKKNQEKREKDGGGENTEEEEEKTQGQRRIREAQVQNATG